MTAARGLGEGRIKSYWVMGTGFQFYKMKRVMGMDDGDGFTT